MTDDPDEVGTDEPVEAAQAFEALRAEVAGLRKAVAALPAAWEASRPPDTTPTLGGIVRGLASVTGRLEAIERHPALAKAGAELLQERMLELERASQGVAYERGQLRELVGGARRRQEQRAWLATTGLAALVAGLVLSPLAAGALPFGLDGRVAALILREDRWTAGMTLMRAASPETWDELASATHLARANEAKLGSCKEAASKARKEQRCTITVPAP